LSQIFTSSLSSPPPPDVPTDFITDDGTAIPSLNILNVNGLDSSENNINGILTRANPDLSNNLEVVVTNRLQGSATTISTGTADIITFVPTVIGTYALEYRISVYNTTTPLGAGYSLFGAIRFDGVNSNICDAFDEIVNEEGAMTNVDIAVIVSGANVILRATGYLAQTINWSAVSLYTFIGV
jgi:hypothetical protein